MPRPYRKAAPQQIDHYWEPRHEFTPDGGQTITEMIDAYVSRNVVSALLDSEMLTKLRVYWKAGKTPRFQIGWTGLDHPTGRDIFNGERDLAQAFVECVEFYEMDADQRADAAAYLERLARKIRKGTK